MIDVSKKNQIERSVLGCLVSHPNIGLHLVERLTDKCFTSDARRRLFRHVLEEKRNGMEVDFKTFDDELMEVYKDVYTQCNLININGYINILLNEVNLTHLYEVGGKVQTMVTNDKNIDAIVRFVENSLLDLENQVDEFHTNVRTAKSKIKEGVIDNRKFDIGIDIFDKYAQIRPRTITILAGNEGSFKTKFTIFVMRKLLKRYPDDISLLWYSMEDPTDKLMRAFIAQDTFLTDEELLDMGNDYAELIPKDIMSADIEFITRSSTIKEVGDEFKKFRKRREGRVCILVIDNLMKIIPINPRIDESKEIVREIESWNIKTADQSSIVFALHHFTKEGVDQKHKGEAYKPYIGYMKGNGIYKDAATQILLINALMRFKEVVKPFTGYSEHVGRIYLVDVAKNRNKEGVIKRLMAYPEYNIFVELD